MSEAIVAQRGAFAAKLPNLCGCETIEGRPYCDGSHNRL
jgi:CDGSH-type Zn-finger protein